MIEIDCICPQTSTGQKRHETDRIELHDTLTFRAALTVRNAIGLIYQEDPGAGVAEVLAAMSETYVLIGIKSWTIVDARNQKVPVSAQNIRELLLPHWEAAATIAEEADRLYSPKVITPLLERASKSSPPSQTNGSTSVPISSPQRPRKQSKPSSTTTTRTDGITPTSMLLAGDSNS
jgi:hypothetical protein